MTAATELQDAEAEYRSAVRRAESLREARDQMIRNALRDGWTYARVAEATGLSKGRIGQFGPRNPPQKDTP